MVESVQKVTNWLSAYYKTADGRCSASSDGAVWDYVQVKVYRVDQKSGATDFILFYLPSSSKYKCNVYSMQLTAVWEGAARHEVH